MAWTRHIATKDAAAEAYANTVSSEANARRAAEVDHTVSMASSEAIAGRDAEVVHTAITGS
jgi:hypothetical protein